MANFTSTAAKFLPIGAIVTQISVLVKFSILARGSCVNNCGFIMEFIAGHQDHSFEGLCSEDAYF